MRTDPRFGHPFPLLGFYRDREPEIAAWQIKWAVEHDIVFLPLTGIATTKRVTYVIAMRRWSKDFSTLGIVSNFDSSWNQECLGSPRCAGRPVGGVGVGAR